MAKAAPVDTYALSCERCDEPLGSSVSVPLGAKPRLSGYVCAACGKAIVLEREASERENVAARALELLEQAGDVLAEGKGSDDVRARIRAKLADALGVGSLRVRLEAIEDLATKALEAAAAAAPKGNRP